MARGAKGHPGAESPRRAARPPRSPGRRHALATTWESRAPHLAVCICRLLPRTRTMLEQSELRCG